MTRPAPRTLTPAQQREELAAGHPGLAKMLREISKQTEGIEALLDLIAVRTEKAATQATTLPASGVDEIHGRTVQPGAEAGMEFVVSAWQQLATTQDDLRKLLGFAS